MRKCRPDLASFLLWFTIIFILFYRKHVEVSVRYCRQRLLDGCWGWYAVCLLIAIVDLKIPSFMCLTLYRPGNPKRWGGNPAGGERRR